MPAREKSPHGDSLVLISAGPIGIGNDSGHDKTLEELGDCTLLALCIDFAPDLRNMNMHHTLGDDHAFHLWKATFVLQLPVT